MVASALHEDASNEDLGLGLHVQLCRNIQDASNPGSRQDGAANKKHVMQSLLA